MDVYSLPSQPANLDAVGIFYFTFLGVWTALVAIGIAFLIVHRRNPIVRIRSLPLYLTAIGLLHAYWVLGQLVYPIGATMNTLLAYDMQYFFMGIWFPLGMAFFHAANFRFLHVAQRQKIYSNGDIYIVGARNREPSRPDRCQDKAYLRRIFTLIIGGMIVQVLLTVGMWLACRKYHPSFGIPGTGLPRVDVERQLATLGRGWEWWPTLLWQFIWSWIVAPYLIVKSWNINDTLGWRLQTIGSCIANLHATPMFLVASYVSAFAQVNKYFAPSNWIHLSILFLVIFTIFVPCIEVLKSERLRKQALVFDMNVFEEELTLSPSTSSASSSKTTAYDSSAVGDRSKTRVSFLSVNDKVLLTKSALDQMLRTNPLPLQEFSALRDFSGENVAFIVCVTRWKASWTHDLQIDCERTRKMFERAVEIYASFVSSRDADFPVNLPWQIITKLENIFELAARVIYGEIIEDPANLAFEFNPRPETKCQRRADFMETTRKSQYKGDIPNGFVANVFDEAKAHIQQLVFINTWPKFVQDVRENEMGRSETVDCTRIWSQQNQLVERAETFIRSTF